MLRRGHWLWILVLVGIACTACARHDLAATVLDPAAAAQLATLDESLLEISFPEASSAGTACPISPTHLLTCVHVLPADARLSRFTIDGREMAISPLLSARLDGEPVQVRLVLDGDRETLAGDWAVLEVTSPGTRLPPPVEFDADRSLARGDALILAGYWAGGPEPPPGSSLEVGLTHVNARVTAPPLPWLSVPDGFICVEAEDDIVYEGISGGPVFTWDDERERLVAVGIYRGRREWSFMGIMLGVHVVIRVPASVVERERTADTP